MEEASSSGGKRTLRVSIPLLLLVPSIGLFLAFFVLPIGVLAINSLHGYSRLSGIIPIYTFNNYKTIFLDSYYLDIIGRTLRLAFLTSFFTLLIGYPVALYLTIATPRHRAWTILFIISPLLVSVIVRTFGWLVVLGPNGLVESALAQLPAGLIVGVLMTGMGSDGAQAMGRLRAAGGEPEHIVSMQIFVTDVPAYKASLRELAGAWKRNFGTHYPAAGLFGVTRLFDDPALIELMAVAVIPAEQG